MPVTITQESRQRSRLSIDVNYAGDRYKTTNGLYTFPSFELEMYDKYLFYLLKNAEQRKFERQYKMRPDFLSHDEYGTVALAQMLMYVNTVPSIEMFDLDTVVIPSFNSVVEILKDKFAVQNPDDLFEVDI